MREVVRFRDLVVLAVIMDNSDPPEEFMLSGVLWTRIPQMANEWIEKREVPVNYTLPITGTSQIQNCLWTLISLDLISHIGKRRGYRSTENADWFMKQIGWDWREWPLSAPVHRGSIVLSEAVMAESYRGSL